MATEILYQKIPCGVLLKAPVFDLERTLDCGQAFRWVQADDNEWHGVAFSRSLTLKKTENGIEFLGTNEEDFEKIWVDYFDLNRDYNTLCERFMKDSHLKTAVTECDGIRVLHQEPWEAICSFIISANNNIPRIKGIIDRLCRLLGNDLGNGDFSFPSAEKIAAAGIDALAPIRAGFRAKYIIDAAEKVSRGEIDFEKIRNSSLCDARDELIKIKGVGEKVAQCAMLYGFGKADAFPVDVWVKRIVEELYPNGLPECMGEERGIAQQYLFHWRRTAV